MRVDRTSANTVESLELSRGAQVVSLDVKVKRSQRQNDRDEDGCSRGDHDQGEHGCTTTSVNSITDAHQDGYIPLAELTNNMLNVRLLPLDCDTRVRAGVDLR